MIYCRNGYVVTSVVFQNERIYLAAVDFVKSYALVGNDNLAVGTFYRINHARIRI